MPAGIASERIIDRLTARIQPEILADASRMTHIANRCPAMMSRLSRRSIHENGGWMGRDPDAPPAEASNRRRLTVFLPTLMVALAVSLAIVWLRPAEYRATARVEITPGTTAAPNAPSAPITNSGPEP